MTIQQYIEENLPKTIRYMPQDEPPRFGLPYPFIVPCAKDAFQEMYYWDSYFTNAGLIAIGESQQAKYNVDNLLSLLDRFGFVLNGSHEGFLHNSQPPFLSLMMREVYEVFPNREWLGESYPKLQKEYDFWTTRRLCDCGLYRYDCEPLPDDQITGTAEALVSRLGHRPEGVTDRELARGLRSFGESGWDCTPRFTYDVYNYAPADLNSLLYAMTDNLAFFASELGLTAEATAWQAKRDAHAARMRELLKNENGVFMDYYTKNRTHGAVHSAACFYPLYVGMATAEEAAAAVSEVLPRIETAHGVSCCEQCEVPGVFQWGYPNGWAPTTRVVVEGLLRYGYREEALRIAAKFVETIECRFAQTGHLWEKYNVVEQDGAATDEYEMPAMLGWTFSAYVCFCKLLGKDTK